MIMIDVASLTLGNLLAQGGQGSVYELADDPSQVFKRYHDPDHPNFRAQTLQRLVGERDHISYVGHPVDEFAAWPHAVVADGSKAIGCLMQRVPPEFELRLGTTKRLADLSFLATSPKPMWGTADLPDPSERIQIVEHLAGAIDVLHGRKIVLGDVSFANVLWSRIPRPRIMLLDCDGMRHEDGDPVLPQPDTVDWNDPQASPGTAPDRDSDRYKLALAVLRVLTKQLDARPDGHTRLLDRGMAPSIRAQCEVLLHKAAGPAGTRPTAAEWAHALSGQTTGSTLAASANRQRFTP